MSSSSWRRSSSTGRSPSASATKPAAVDSNDTNPQYWEIVQPRRSRGTRRRPAQITVADCLRLNFSRLVQTISKRNSLTNEGRLLSFFDDDLPRFCDETMSISHRFRIKGYCGSFSIRKNEIHLNYILEALDQARYVTMVMRE